MIWPARLSIALLAGLMLTSENAQAAPAAAQQNARPAAQQREDRAQPDRWTREDSRRPSGDEDDGKSDSDDDDEDEDKDQPPRHPGELNGKLNLGNWV